MDKSINLTRDQTAGGAAHDPAVAELLHEMGGNWGEDVIETLIDTPYATVTTDNGLEPGDLYGGEYFLASERVESLPESQLIDAMWPENTDAMVILDAEQFPDLGLNSFDHSLINGGDAAEILEPAPVTATPAAPPAASKQEKFYITPLRRGARINF
ncbi:MAG: hypothetical protein QM537_05415 [Candidatus Symbiobacter sp.]|nr:hypothetical protein [Candidatus Symbiobacter sp.]